MVRLLKLHLFGHVDGAHAYVLLPSSRLINYTPTATALRLVSVSALNGYLQSWTVYLSGSSQDPFLLLPTWVTITSVCFPILFSMLS